MSDSPMMHLLHGVRLQLREARLSHDWLTVSNVEEAIYAALRKMARDELAPPAPPTAPDAPTIAVHDSDVVNLGGGGSYGIDPTPAPDDLVRPTAEEITKGIEAAFGGRPPMEVYGSKWSRVLWISGYHAANQIAAAEIVALRERIAELERDIAAIGPDNEVLRLRAERAEAAIVALRERIAELEETFDTLRGNAKYQQDRAERAEARLAEATKLIAELVDNKIGTKKWFDATRAARAFLEGTK